MISFDTALQLMCLACGFYLCYLLYTDGRDKKLPTAPARPARVQALRHDPLR
jgi:hypothetical protein